MNQFINQTESILGTIVGIILFISVFFIIGWIADMFKSPEEQQVDLLRDIRDEMRKKNATSDVKEGRVIK